MSENEKDAIEKVHECIASIEKAKTWFWRSALIMLGTSLAMIASMAVATNKLAYHEEMFNKAASRHGVMQLVDIHQAEVKAILNLIDSPDAKQAVKEINDIVNKVNGNIFLYSLPVSRGGKVTGGAE